MHGQILALQTVETPAVDEKEVNQQQAQEKLTAQTLVPPKPPKLGNSFISGPFQSIIRVHSQSSPWSTVYTIPY